MPHTKKNKPQYNKKIITVIGAFLLLVTLFVGYTYGPFTPLSQRKSPPKEQWITIFSHGSFGTTLGLLSVMNVIKDSVDGTTYKKLTSSMRYDPHFYQTQPMLEPGLHSFTPTFDCTTQGIKKYAIYPITAAYKKIKTLSKKTEDEYFYAFGWSGLVSQQRRRKEAIRFYNMLQKEIHKIKAHGSVPKIRIITHSHGGNVALNMAGVSTLVSLGLDTPITAEQFPDTDERTALQALQKDLRQTKAEELVIHNKHQKKWDYTPSSEPFAVDELIVLGTPIQPETVHFFSYPFFRTIYNVYSKSDVVQSMDWVSTRRYYSEQRVPEKYSKSKHNRLIQVQLSVNKEHKKFAKNKKQQKHASWWSRLFKKPSGEEKDPQHKELWFMSWDHSKLEKISCQQHIAPLPFVIFVPTICAMIEQTGQSRAMDNDLACDIAFSKQAIKFTLANYHNNREIYARYLPKAFVEALQKRASVWRPFDITPHEQMNILSGYSNIIGA